MRSFDLTLKLMQFVILQREGNNGRGLLLAWGGSSMQAPRMGGSVARTGRVQGPA